MEPKMPSEILNGALTYSKAWKPVKMAANNTVKTKPKTASFLLPAVIAWWEYVIVAQNKQNQSVYWGISKGLKASMPFGGQTFPTSIVGAILAAKKAQKKAKKHNFRHNK